MIYVFNIHTFQDLIFMNFVNSMIFLLKYKKLCEKTFLRISKNYDFGVLGMGELIFMNLVKIVKINSSEILYN